MRLKTHYVGDDGGTCARDVCVCTVRGGGRPSSYDNNWCTDRLVVMYACKWTVERIELKTSRVVSQRRILKRDYDNDY